jgi:hypothetical protein
MCKIFITYTVSLLRYASLCFKYKFWNSVRGSSTTNFVILPWKLIDNLQSAPACMYYQFVNLVQLMLHVWRERACTINWIAENCQKKWFKIEMRDICPNCRAGDNSRDHLQAIEWPNIVKVNLNFRRSKNGVHFLYVLLLSSGQCIRSNT